MDTIDSEGRGRTPINDWTVREIVSAIMGGRSRSDEAYIIDVHYSEHDPIGRLYRAWDEVPDPVYGPIREKNWHGTVSGVHRSRTAPRCRALAATVIPVAESNLTDDQKDEILEIAQEIYHPSLG